MRTKNTIIFCIKYNLIQVQVYRLNHSQSEITNIKDTIIQVHIHYNANTNRVHYNNVEQHYF